MNYFLDTEFTDLPWTGRSELIALGLVSETGDAVQITLNQFSEERCSDFVKVNVLPLLPAPEERVTNDVAKDILDAFIGREPVFWAWMPTVHQIAALTPDAKPNELHARYADWDFQLFQTLCEPTYPQRLANLCYDLQGLVPPGATIPTNAQPHDQLADARWARDVWLSLGGPSPQQTKTPPER